MYTDESAGEYVSVDNVHVEALCEYLSSVYKVLESALGQRKVVPAALTEKVTKARHVVDEALSTLKDIGALVDSQPGQVKSRSEVRILERECVCVCACLSFCVCVSVSPSPD